MTQGLIIFDNDGVLVDTEPLYMRAEVSTFQAAGFPVNAAWINAHMMGRRESDFPGIFIKAFGRTPTSETFHAVKEKFLHLVETELQPIPGVFETLETLNSRGFTFCIATSGSIPETLLKHQKTKLNYWFKQDCIFSGNQVPRGKPAPDLVLHAAASMGYEPEQCIVVEDSPFGVQGARAAGMPAIGFTGGGHYADTTSGVTAMHLHEAGANIIVPHMNELADAILTILTPR